MRKIESQMNQAITQERDWKKENTSVINIEGVSFVYLYNNLIAMVVILGWNCLMVVINQIPLSLVLMLF